ncbi:MAG: tail fiber protein [Methyloceanibacter sp.]|uniref:tail fiber protein n=1 Tax=Methyloceanibacter sp. TaxID=1965321 RepID=UPI003D6D8960
MAGSATGEWLGWDKRIARFIDGEWRSYLPGAGGGQGWRAWVIDEAAFYVFDGADWNLYSGGGGGGVSDGDKGDITVSGGGGTWTVDNDAVTFAKMQNVTSDRLIGRDTASSGDPEEITVSGGVEFTGSGGIRRSALTGDVTASAGSNSTTIANNAVTNAKTADMAAWTIKLRNAGSSGDPSDAALASLTEEGSPASGDFLVGFLGTGEIRKFDVGNLPGGGGGGAADFIDLGDVPASYSGQASKLVAVTATEDGLEFITSASLTDGDKGDITVSGGGATWTVDNDAITFAKMQDIATDSLIGRDTAGTGDPENITLNTTLSMSAGQLRRAALTGDVTASAGSNSTTIANNAVTNAKAADMAAWSFKLRNAGSSGDPSDVALADLTEEASPAAGDFLVGFLGSGEIRKFDVGNLPGGGGGGASGFIGLVFWHAGTSPPAFALECDGSAVSRTTYAGLFAEIGTTFGPGDGSTTFDLPDLITDNRFIRAADGSAITVGTTQSSGLPNITGSINANPTVRMSGSGAFSDDGSTTTGSNTGTGSANSDLAFDASDSNAIYGAAAEVRPNNIALLPCIVF